MHRKFNVPCLDNDHVWQSTSVSHVKSSGIPHPWLPHLDDATSFGTDSGNRCRAAGHTMFPPGVSSGQLSTTPALAPYVDAVESDDLESSCLSSPTESQGTSRLLCAQLSMYSMSPVC